MNKDGGLRSLFRSKLPAIHWTTIENGFTEPGVPDQNGCHSGVEFWIEHKQTKGWTVGLRPEQIGWLMRRTRCGGRCFIAVRRGEEELWLYPGGDAARLGAEGMKAVSPIGRYEEGPANWPWWQIANILIGKRIFG